MKIKDPNKAAKIIAVTNQLIVAHGSIDVSTSQIAKKMGIAQSNIYLYFKNKQDLLQKVYLSAIDSLGKFFETKIQPTESKVIQLEQHIRGLYDFARQFPEEMTVIGIIQRNPSFQLDLTLAEKGNINHQVYKLFASSTKEGLFRANSVKVSKDLVFNTMESYVLELNKHEITEQDVPLQTVVEMIMAALLTPTVNAEWLHETKKVK